MIPDPNSNGLIYVTDIVNAWETRGIRRVGVGGMHLVVTGIKDG